MFFISGHSHVKLIYLNLLFIIISINISAQVYIDYKVYTEDFYARTKWETGEEEAVWNIKYKLTNTNYSDVSCYHDSNNGYGDNSGYWWRRDVEQIWSGTCLDNEDALTIYLEGWENDSGEMCEYDSGDDSHLSDSDTDNDISLHNRNTIEAIYTTEGKDKVDCESSDGDYLYQVRFKVWWNYSIPQNPVFSIDNIEYTSFTINKTSNNNYHITSWDYQVSTNSSFTQIAQTGTGITSNSTLVSGLDRYTTYYIRIRGTNEGGTGDYTSYQTITTLYFPSGDGTTNNPYEITNLQDLLFLSDNSDYWGYYYIQTDNIDASETTTWNNGAGWDPIGESPIDCFLGIYNGNNYNISNLYINRPEESYCGLFASANQGSIVDLALTNVNITGGGSVGGLCGYSRNDHIINGCYVTGTINGNDTIGGLVGYTAGNVDSSYTSVSITGNTSVGGLIGCVNSASINNSYAIHNIQAIGSTGGLFGYCLDVTALNCYCDGNIIIREGSSDKVGSFLGFMGGYDTLINNYALGSVTYTSGFSTTNKGFVGAVAGNIVWGNNFFNSEISNQISGLFAKPLTRAQMQSLETYIDASWDMIGSNEDDYWDIDGVTNSGYPFLSWQKPRKEWLGSTSTNPATSSNWIDNSTPASTDNILVKAGSTNPITFIAEASSPASYNNIAIESGATLNIEAGKATTINHILYNNGTIEIKSNENGTGSLLVQKEVLGDVNIQRYLINAIWTDWQDGWHQIASPVDDYPITNNFTVSPETDYDFYTWSEPDNQWINFKNGVNPTFFQINGSNNFELGTGYLAAYKNASTKNFNGEININDVSVSDLNITGTTQDHRSWHLLGNPFTCGITWDASDDWNKSNISGTAKIWNEANKSYSDITSGDVIPVTNGFMVQAAADGASLTIPESKRTHGGNFYKTVDYPLIKLKANNLDNPSAQESQLIFNPESTNKWDIEYDSDFLPGYAPSFYSLAENTPVSVNSMPAIEENTSIPFIFIPNEGLNFSIEMYDVQNLNLDVWLLDKKLNKDINLSEKQIYVFTSFEQDAGDRFTIHFTPVGINEVENYIDPINVFSNGKSITIINNNNLGGMVKIVNILGQEVGSFTLNRNNTQDYKLDCKKGVYIVYTELNNGNIYSEKIIIR